MMRYLSVCSGIEAASVAWKPLGWRPVGFSEIEKFPAAVLAHHYPDVQNYGDMTKFKEWPDDLAPNLIVGGTPCQSFSVAGLRKGLADPRGNLALTYLALADRYRPEWLVWENVPGVLSSNGGRDFGAFLGGLVELGYGFAYRVLDAQYFGVAQRRRRVFVVANARDWRRAAAVLFERHSLSGHPAPRREAGEELVKCLTRGAAQRFDAETETMIPVAHTLRGEGFDASEDGTGRGTPLVPVKTGFQGDSLVTSQMAWPCLTAQGGNNGGGPGAIYVNPAQSAVRRLTPRECERLQGFPDAQKCYTILVCRDLSDQQKANALAALQCRRLPSNAWSAAGSGWMLSAEAAAHHSSTSHHDRAPLVAVDVLIDLERQEVRLHSAGRSLSPASNVDGRSGFPLPTGIDNFARLAALLTHAWALATPDGREGSQPNIKPSSPLWSGRGIAISYGHETGEHAAAVATAIETANRLSTSITLPSGLDTETLRSILATLSCCVVHAIAGCIPETTNRASCFVVRLTTSQGYTAIPWRSKPASECPDGPRYKALGNSMAVPVMAWIGERIAAVAAQENMKEVA